MKSFKEYTKYRNLQSLNERLFGKVNYAGKDIRVYINPTISDVGSLIMDGAMRIRGFNKGDHIFIWPEDDASHHGMSGELGNLDPDLSGKPDICFYFAVEEKNPIKVELQYSSFTGTSAKSGEGTNAILQRLLKFPPMEKLKPFIQNYDEIVNWKPRVFNFKWHPESGAKFDPHDHSHQAAYTHDPHHAIDNGTHDFDDFFQHTYGKAPDANPNPYMTHQYMQKPKMNPYRWKSGLHRVGD